MKAPALVAPMLARLAAALPEGPGWLFEVKFDGIRALCVKSEQSARLFSRKPRELTAEYPEIAAQLGKIRRANFMLDGEVVALDDEGRSSFQLLQNRGRDESVRPRIYYYAFDLLHLDGEDLTRLPLRKRKKMLQSLLRGQGDKVRVCSTLEGPPAQIWKHACKLGLEGIVAKREDSEYEPGRRSGAWLKMKTVGEQEFVIGGYTAPKGTRAFFGALLVGTYQGERLIFASKVGTGFDAASLRSLYETFRKYKTDRCPFDGGLGGEFGRVELNHCAWLKPLLVCQIKFAQWTSDGKLRQPVFLGLREDKKPKDV